MPINFDRELLRDKKNHVTDEQNGQKLPSDLKPTQNMTALGGLPFLHEKF
jgi:hypothetical protein